MSTGHKESKYLKQTLLFPPGFRNVFCVCVCVTPVVQAATTQGAGHRKKARAEEYMDQPLLLICSLSYNKTCVPTVRVVSRRAGTAVDRKGPICVCSNHF